jgi:hypothetical protein
MFTNFNKKIEIAANLTIVLVATLVAVVLVKDHLLTRSANQSGSSSAASVNNGAPGSNSDALRLNGPKPGTKVNVSGINWAENQKTLVLALSNTCHFCTDSADLYQRLAEQRKEKGLKIVAILPQSVADGQAYLKKLGVSVDDVKQAPLASFGVSGTPTLILVDRDGVTRQSWIGKLSADKETDFLKSL